MALPEPQPGLVISYAYLWHREHGAERVEGVKHRPCVIVLAVARPKDGVTLVRVVPVTHSAPRDPAVAIELSRSVKRHLGHDDERSWVMLDEVNDFAWPGFDLRPVPHDPGSLSYGFLRRACSMNCSPNSGRSGVFRRARRRDEIELPA